MLHPRTLGQAVAEVRNLRGLTQKVVAERASLTVNYLSLIENGERNASFESLNAIAAALRVPPEWLLFLGGEASTGPLAGPEFAELHETTRKALRDAIEADTDANNLSAV